MKCGQEESKEPTVSRTEQQYMTLRLQHAPDGGNVALIAMRQLVGVVVMLHDEMFLAYLADITRLLLVGLLVFEEIVVPGETLLADVACEVLLAGMQGAVSEQVFLPHERLAAALADVGAEPCVQLHVLVEVLPPLKAPLAYLAYVHLDGRRARIPVTRTVIVCSGAHLYVYFVFAFVGVAQNVGVRVGDDVGESHLGHFLHALAQEVYVYGGILDVRRRITYDVGVCRNAVTASG